jgi:hypothetical protein
MYGDLYGSRGVEPGGQWLPGVGPQGLAGGGPEPSLDFAQIILNIIRVKKPHHQLNEA